MSLTFFFRRFAPIISILKWAAVIGLVVFLVLLWRNGRNQDAAITKAKADNAALEKDKSALQQDIAAKQKHIDDLEGDVSAANAQHEKDSAAIAEFRKKPSTPDTVNEGKPAGLGDIVDCRATPERCTNTNIQITGDAQANLDALHKAEADQKQCKADIVQCERTLTDRTGQYADAKAQYEDEKKKRILTELQRDNLQTALNGGTKWTRTKKEVKCAGIGGILAAAAAQAPRKKSIWAFVGAAGGEIGCHVFGQ